MYGLGSLRKRSALVVPWLQLPDFVISPHISFYLILFLLYRPGLGVLVITPWPTFQIQVYRKVRFRTTWQRCGDTEPNSVFIAYLDVRSDKSETNWLLLDYEACVLLLHSKGFCDVLTFATLWRPQNDRSDKLVLTQTGSGGLDELSGFLDDSKASYGYARISYSNDKESQREKFVLVVWIGKDTKVMRKAKVRSFS